MAMDTYSPSHPTDDNDNDEMKYADRYIESEVTRSKSKSPSKLNTSSSRDKKRARSRSRSQSKKAKSKKSSRHRSKSRDRGRRDRSRGRSKGRSGDRSRGRSTERRNRRRGSSDRVRDKSPDKSRNKSADKSRNRSRERSRNRSAERSRNRSSDRRGRSNERNNREKRENSQNIPDRKEDVFKLEMAPIIDVIPKMDPPMMQQSSEPKESWDYNSDEESKPKAEVSQMPDHNTHDSFSERIGFGRECFDRGGFNRGGFDRGRGTYGRGGFGHGDDSFSDRGGFGRGGFGRGGFDRGRGGRSDGFPRSPMMGFQASSDGRGNSSSPAGVAPQQVASPGAEKPDDKFADDSDEEFGAWGKEQKAVSATNEIQANLSSIRDDGHQMQMQSQSQQEFGRGGWTGRGYRGGGGRPFMPGRGGPGGPGGHGGFQGRPPWPGQFQQPPRFGGGHEPEEPPCGQDEHTVPTVVVPGKEVSGVAEDSDEEEFGAWGKEQKTHTVREQPAPENAAPTGDNSFQGGGSRFGTPNNINRGGGYNNRYNAGGAGGYNNRGQNYQQRPPFQPPPPMNESFNSGTGNQSGNFMMPRGMAGLQPAQMPPFGFNPSQMPPWMPPPAPPQLQGCFNGVPTGRMPFSMELETGMRTQPLLPVPFSQLQQQQHQQQLLQQTIAALIPPPPPVTQEQQMLMPSVSSAAEQLPVMTSANFLETLMTKAGLSSDTLRLQQEKQQRQQQQQAETDPFSSLLKSAASTVISRLVEGNSHRKSAAANDNMSMSPPSPPQSQSPSSRSPSPQPPPPPPPPHTAVSASSDLSFVPPPLPVYSDSILKPTAAANKLQHLPQPPNMVSAPPPPQPSHQHRQPTDVDENKRMRKEFENKIDWQERIALEVKNYLKPAYMSKKINKNDYKEIMKRAVTKISRSGVVEINSEKIEKFVSSYVEKYSRGGGRKTTKAASNENDDFM